MTNKDEAWSMKHEKVGNTYRIQAAWIYSWRENKHLWVEEHTAKRPDDVQNWNRVHAPQLNKCSNQPIKMRPSLRKACGKYSASSIKAEMLLLGWARRSKENFLASGNRFLSAFVIEVVRKQTVTGYLLSLLFLCQPVNQTRIWRKTSLQRA